MIKLFEDDEWLYRWLVAVETVGICKVEGVPRQLGEMHKVAARVSWLRAGNYGYKKLMDNLVFVVYSYL